MEEKQRCTLITVIIKDEYIFSFKIIADKTESKNNA